MTASDILVISEEAGGRKGNYFDGTGDFVQHNAHAIARVAGNDTVGTYTAWIYIENVAGTFTVLGAGANASATEYLRLYVQAGALYVKTYFGGAVKYTVKTTTADIPARTWTHIALVHNATRPTLYVNGVAVAMTDNVSTDLTFWYDTLTGLDEFTIGATTINNVETYTMWGAIGRVKYWNLELSPEEILEEKKEVAHERRPTTLSTPLFDITMEADGTTDSGLGLDNGTLVANAYYGGYISDWSYHLNYDALITGHAAEFMNTFIDGSKYVSVIKKGD